VTPADERRMMFMTFLLSISGTKSPSPGEERESAPAFITVSGTFLELVCGPDYALICILVLFDLLETVCIAPCKVLTYLDIVNGLGAGEASIEILALNPDCYYFGTIGV
jgi:hypothetical protein